ncbi:MAG: Rieske 2Fe-2S domain-containing protein [Deltaproteobacteria bacterium]|nr:Rieske 2Fe-2S domain-containing protein [Deltaproteobacteria bacterium]
MTSRFDLLRTLALGRPSGLRAKLRARLRRGLRSEAAAAQDASPPLPPVAPQGAAGWVRVARVDEIPVGDITEVMVDGVPVALVHAEDGWFAMDNACPHAGGPLGDGDLDGHTVLCPYHGWAFDVRSGACHTNERLKVGLWEVRVVGEGIEVRRTPAG